MRALAPVIPDRVTAGWNQLLCSLSTGLDTRKNDTYVDICFMGLKGGSGAMKGTDGYDHIGRLNRSLGSYTRAGEGRPASIIRVTA